MNVTNEKSETPRETGGILTRFAALSVSMLFIQAAVMLCVVLFSGAFTMRYNTDTRSYVRFYKELFPNLIPPENNIYESGAVVEDKSRETEPRLPSGVSTRLDILKWTLNKARTAGYPTFLIAVNRISPGLRNLPFIQYLVHALAVIFFFYSLLVFGFRKPVALISSSALLYVPIVITHCAVVLTDCLAASLAVFCAGFLFRVVVKPRSAGAWCGLTAFVFLACQVRPAYLFIVPLVPFSGAIFVFIRNRSGFSLVNFKKFISFSTGLAASSTIPLLLFCLLRFALIGHFGFSTFGGLNIAGISMQMLSIDTILALPPNQKPVANTILMLRSKSSIPPCCDDDSLSWYEYNVMFNNYNQIVYRVSMPVVRMVSWSMGKDADWVSENRILTDLSARVIRMRPRLYAQIVWKSFVVALRDTASKDRLLLGAFIFLIAAAMFRVLLRRTAELKNDSCHGGFTIEFWPMLIFALCFYFAKIFLVILVEMPILRYLYAASLFIPPALAAGAASIFANAMEHKTNGSQK